MVKMRLLASHLALVLFLCMVHTCFSASGREMIVVFKGGQTEVSFQENNGAITKRKSRAFHVPAFVGGIINENKFLMALCNAHYKSYSNRIFIDAAVKTSYGNYTTWSDAEIVATSTRNITKTSVLGDLIAVMKGNKIYVFAHSWDKLDSSWFNPIDNIGWDPLMIVGTVTNRTDSNGSAGVYVQWDKGTSLKSLLPKRVLGSTGLWFIGGLGNGVVTKNGTIIFPIQITNNWWQYASSIIYSTDDGSSWHIGGTTEQGPSQCSVTEWGNGKLLLSARYDGGVRKVYESNDMGTTWKESTIFSEVWGNNQYRLGIGSQGSLITVSVDGEDVLLFSHPLNTRDDYERDTLQLWMSDGQRIKFVGVISEDGKGDQSGYSILAHVGNHLYSMHEINPYGEWSKYNDIPEEWDRVIALSSLPDLFDSVKNTARAWRQLDAELSAQSVPTNGLVGLLADSNSNNVWANEYNSVNAIVKGASPVPGGFRFDGTQGSGAQWPVESQGQNQFYIFTEKQFTIAATVTIHSTAETGDHLLLGASVDEAGTKLFIGLGYTQDNRWSAADADGIIMTTGVSFKLEKEYHVAITFANGAVSVYVSGVFIINWRKTNYVSSTISHFFMGGIRKSSTTKGCLCTVKNVMLFNRVLNQTEVNKIENVVNYVNQKELTPRKTPTVTATVTNTVTLEDSKLSSVINLKETSDPGSHIIPHEDEDDESEISDSKDSESSAENPEADNNDCDGEFNDFCSHCNDRDSQKGHKHGDGAVGTISFTTWICFVYSPVVLVGF